MLPRIVSDGIYYALALLVGGVVVSVLTTPIWGIPMFAAAVFCLNFFRDPERMAPSGAVAVSPADGKILDIREVGAGLRRISIFMNVFNVHVNRSPIAGKITKIHHRNGRFLAANQEEAAEQNEHNTVTIEGEGTSVVFRQIAGLIARRIVFYKKEGDFVNVGERVGLIKFGSRVDVFLGQEWEVKIRKGEKVKAGSNVLAYRKTGLKGNEDTKTV